MSNSDCRTSRSSYCLLLQVSDLNPLWLGVAKLTQLRELRVRFYCNSLIKTTGRFDVAVRNLKHLRILVLDFKNIVISNLGSLGAGLALLLQLEELGASFINCDDLVDLGPLGAGLSNLSNLKQLSLDFYDCNSLTDLAPIGRGLSGLAAAEVVTMNFKNCDHLTDLGPLQAGLAGLGQLREVKLDFSFCLQLTDTSPLIAGFAGRDPLSPIVKQGKGQVQRKTQAQTVQANGKGKGQSNKSKSNKALPKALPPPPKPNALVALALKATRPTAPPSAQVSAATCTSPLCINVLLLMIGGSGQFRHLK